MTTLERVNDLFVGYPFPGRDLVWLVDELIAIAQHTGPFALGMHRAPDGPATCLVCAAQAGSQQLKLQQVRTGVFRAILARIAKLGSDETGVECNPYGDRFALTRSSRSGPVRLEIEFTNTPASQELTILRTPITAAPLVPAATAPSASADPTTHPSA